MHEVCNSVTSTGSGNLLTNPGIIVFVSNANAGVATLKEGGSGGRIILKVSAGRVVSSANLSYTGTLHCDVADVTVGYISSGLN